MGTNTELYTQDFYAWCLTTAALIREGKWQYQPAGRQESHSWADSIRAARRQVTRLLVRHPSLQSRLSVAFARAYPHARREASDETQLPLATFPEQCPWMPAQVLDEDFWPQE